MTYQEAEQMLAPFFEAVKKQASKSVARTTVGKWEDSMVEGFKKTYEIGYLQAHMVNMLLAMDAQAIAREQAVINLVCKENE